MTTTSGSSGSPDHGFDALHDEHFPGLRQPGEKGPDGVAAGQPGGLAGQGETMADRPLRADARRNRERVLQAARDAFGASGYGVSMDEIAARAGVGPGTVYRHFPDKKALFEAVRAGITARDLIVLFKAALASIQDASAGPPDPAMRERVFAVLADGLLARPPASGSGPAAG